MKKTMRFIFMIGFILVIAACGATEHNPEMMAEHLGTDASEATETMDKNGNGNGNGNGGGMGMGGGMMARHHATIPEEYAGVANPFDANEASLERGAEIYTASCATCHGDSGMGDGPAAEALDPQPAPIVHTGQMLGDDYLFWRISEGGQMEPFNSSMIAWKDSLDEEARWDVINYIQNGLGGDGTMAGHESDEPFDMEAELAHRAEMLVNGIEQGIITQEEADLFELVHAGIDEHMAGMEEMGMGTMDDMETMVMDDGMQGMLMDDLMVEGKITQEQAAQFNDIHTRLMDAGFMMME